MCDQICGAPGKVLGLHGDCRNRQFHALVGHLAHVGKQRIEDVGRSRHSVVVEQIVGCAVVVVERNVQAAVEELGVKADVEFFLLFPLQVGVGVGCRLIGVDPLAVVPELAGSSHQYERLIVGEVLVAGHTVAAADFQFVKPFHIAQEGLAADAPAERYGWEPSPLVVFAEARGSVTA